MTSVRASVPLLDPAGVRSVSGNTFLNEKSMSISYTHAGIFPKWMAKIEHKYILKKNGINVTIRKEFGSKVDAACGQLRANQN